MCGMTRKAWGEVHRLRVVLPVCKRGRQRELRHCRRSAPTHAGGLEAARRCSARPPPAKPPPAFLFPNHPLASAPLLLSQRVEVPAHGLVDGVFHELDALRRQRDGVDGQSGVVAQHEVGPGVLVLVQLRHDVQIHSAAWQEEHIAQRRAVHLHQHVGGLVLCRLRAKWLGLQRLHHKLRGGDVMLWWFFLGGKGGGRGVCVLEG